MSHKSTKKEEAQKKAPAHAMMTKLVRLMRNADDLVGSKRYKYYLPFENAGDRVSIAAHPSSVMYQENYLHAFSSTPFRLQFRYIGTSFETGETCHDFSHYKDVKYVEYTNMFTSVPVVFQITSQLPIVKEMLIYLTPENIAMSEGEKQIQLANLKSVYNCPSVEMLVVSIAKWKDSVVSAPLNYETSKLAVIADYTKRCCPNLNVIRLYTDEENKTTKCSEILFKFNEQLQRDFFPKTMVLFGPFKNKKPVERNVGGRKDRYSSGSTVTSGDDETATSCVKTLEEAVEDAKSGLKIEAEDAVPRCLLSTDNEAGMTMNQNPMQGFAFQNMVPKVEGSSESGISGMVQTQADYNNPSTPASSLESATASMTGYSPLRIQDQNAGKNDWDDDNTSDFADEIDHHNQSHPEIPPAPQLKYVKHIKPLPGGSLSPVDRCTSFSTNSMRIPSHTGGGSRQFRGNNNKQQSCRKYSYRAKTSYSNDGGRKGPFDYQRTEWRGRRKNQQFPRQNEWSSGDWYASHSRPSDHFSSNDGTHESRDRKMPHSPSPEDRTLRAKTFHLNQHDSMEYN